MLSQEELQKIKRWANSHNAEPQAKSAEYDHNLGLLTIELVNDAKLHLKPSDTNELNQAPPEQIANFRLSDDGFSLLWEDLGLSLSIPKLFADIFGSKAWMTEPDPWHASTYPRPDDPEW